MISAETPDKTVNPLLYEIVKQHMIHRTCGDQNPKAVCMVDEKNECIRNFPKQFLEESKFNDNHGYPLYKRPNNGRRII